MNYQDYKKVLSQKPNDKEEWLYDLILIANKMGHDVNNPAFNDRDNWLPFYDAGCTPKEALKVFDESR